MSQVSTKFIKNLSVTATKLGSGAATNGQVATADGSGGASYSSAPILSGPIVGTQATTDNSTKAASTAFVTTAVANAIAGVNPAVAVQAATTLASDTSGLTYNNGVSGIGATLTGTTNTAITFDGYTITGVNQRVLVKNDTQSPSGAFNGVYFLSQLQTGLLPPILTRALDYNQPSDINNTGAIPVVNGTLNALTSWLLTSTVNTVGTDSLTYAKFSNNPSSVSSGANTSASINQTAHGFSVGNWLYYTGSAYALAKADADSTSEVLGVVSSVTDVNNFILLNVGQVTGLSGLTAGVTYYLSDSSAGAMTSTAPTTSNHINKPVFVSTSTTAGYAIESRGFAIGAAGTLGVANGGTGDTSFTAYAVISGGTTSNGSLQSIASVGTSGQVLTSNGAGALPTFQTAGGGSLANVNFHANSASSAVDNSSAQVFTSVDWDTNSAYNASTGIYTVPVAGVYMVNAELLFTATSFTTGQVFQTKIFVNGSSVCRGSTQVTTGGNVSNGFFVEAAQLVKCSVNDTIKIVANSNTTSPVSNAVADVSTFSVVLVGT